MKAASLAIVVLALLAFAESARRNKAYRSKSAARAISSLRARELHGLTKAQRSKSAAKAAAKQAVGLTHEACIGCDVEYTGDWNEVIETLKNGTGVEIRKVYEVDRNTDVPITRYVVFSSPVPDAPDYPQKVCIGSYYLPLRSDIPTDFNVRCLDLFDAQ